MANVRWNNACFWKERGDEKQHDLALVEFIAYDTIASMMLDDKFANDIRSHYFNKDGTPVSDDCMAGI
jgi:hypothetical protein